MSIFRNSRYSFVKGERVDGRLVLNARTPLAFREDPGNIVYVVRDGDTLWTLSFRFFRNVPARFRSMLYFVLVEFQPDPIIDPTRRLMPGSTLIIPSEALVLDFLAHGGEGE